ncbi:nitroreductase/quinone reductase family protein [Pseudonocardia sp. TRM90224]|uniref:nitroreductase/quinone reductase family protein n=1 Tax=Pseudonocardia sp. TRM90224 TaxID=2812678 RepID=UPI001E4F94B4|nr:nitroreductase/quinone reductase family protein [Pseudonocardia sp. TRM90224]
MTIDMAAFNRSLIEEFRATGGRPGGPVAGIDLILLTTTGARTGRPHTTPLGYTLDGSPDRIILFASNRGAPRHPAWFHNLVAHSEVQVERRDETFTARARVAEGAEREHLLALWLAASPATATHEAMAGRTIPMVLLQR